MPTYCTADGKKLSKKGIVYFICRTCGQPVGDYRLRVCPSQPAERRPVERPS